MKDIIRLIEGSNITAEEMIGYLRQAGLGDEEMKDLAERGKDAVHGKPSDLNLSEDDLKKIAWAWGQAYNN